MAEYWQYVGNDCNTKVDKELFNFIEFICVLYSIVN